MFIHNIKYPDCIRTEQELNIFFDYVVHGILDEFWFETEFHGVKTQSYPSLRKCTVFIPIRVRVPMESQFEFYNMFDTSMRYVEQQLVGRRVVPLTLSNIDVSIDIRPILPIQAVDFKVEFPEKEEKNMFIPEVNEIRHTKSKRGEFFTVIWRDNTQTTVKLMEGETSDEYTAYLYALGKKLFENKGEGRKFVREKKKVFEDRMAKKSAEKQRQRKEHAMRQSLEAEDLPDISGQVYADMFVAPCMVSRAMFKKNK